MKAQTLKVSRERLIETLRTRLAEHEADRERLFAEALAEQVASAERDARSAAKSAEKLKAVASPDDVAGEYWARPFLAASDLAKQIRLLELSDEETIAVGPTSNLWAWL